MIDRAAAATWECSVFSPRSLLLCRVLSPFSHGVLTLSFGLLRSLCPPPLLPNWCVLKINRNASPQTVVQFVV